MDNGAASRVETAYQATVQVSTFKISYGCVTMRGYYPQSASKPNQDSHVELPRLILDLTERHWLATRRSVPRVTWPKRRPPGLYTVSKRPQVRAQGIVIVEGRVPRLIEPSDAQGHGSGTWYHRRLVRPRVLVQL